jgi:CRISPR-associated endonuclease/helicase Cas3
LAFATDHCLSLRCAVKYVDNREWLDDPSAPAIVVGTVDMIGSRLLFQGYGVSRKMRPYHAGLLGADTLAVLDEAHLVPAFEELLRDIANGLDLFGPQDKALQPLVPPFRLMSLSATGRGGAAMAAFRFTQRISTTP